MDATRFPLPSSPFTSTDGYRPASNLSCRLPPISSTFAAPRNPNASFKPILARAAFADEGHAAYYQSHPTGTCFTSLPEKQKKKKVEAKQLKKKLQRLQGLLRETSALIGDEPNPLANDQVLTETAKIMLERLQQVMVVEETAKARRKGERSVKKKVAGESSSSSSSESSDSDSDGQGMNVLYMSRRRHPRTSVTDDIKSCGHLGMEDVAMDSLLQAGKDDGESRDGNNKGVKALEIEVCMGSKCQKSGAGLVKEELERQVVMGGGGGTVAGCKCMGRCKEGPNVRLSTPNSHTSSVCCGGVSLDDISSLLSSLLPHPLPY